jgi:hypothetical protein
MKIEFDQQGLITSEEFDPSGRNHPSDPKPWEDGERRGYQQVKRKGVFGGGKGMAKPVTRAAKDQVGNTGRIRAGRTG